MTWDEGFNFFGMKKRSKALFNWDEGFQVISWDDGFNNLWMKTGSTTVFKYLG